MRLSIQTCVPDQAEEEGGGGEGDKNRFPLIVIQLLAVALSRAILEPATHS